MAVVFRGTPDDIAGDRAGYPEYDSRGVAEEFDEMTGRVRCGAAGDRKNAVPPFLSPRGPAGRASGTAERCESL